MSIVDNINQAIVNKVDSILKNADCINELHIAIDAEPGDAPTITYNIKESIIISNKGEEE